jgi:hypothetical protein
MKTRRSRGLGGYRERMPALDRLCRTATMVRAGAAWFDNGPKEPSWSGKCQRCRRKGWLQWCHFYSRAIHAVRWDLDNTWAFCAACHYRCDVMEPRHRMRASWFVAFVKEQIGERRFDALVLRAERPGRRPDLTAIELYLKAELKQMLGGGPCPALPGGLDF